jgi:hypothetical protein
MYFSYQVYIPHSPLLVKDRVRVGDRFVLGMNTVVAEQYKR